MDKIVIYDIDESSLKLSKNRKGKIKWRII